MTQDHPQAQDAAVGEVEEEDAAEEEAVAEGEAEALPAPGSLCPLSKETHQV